MADQFIHDNEPEFNAFIEQALKSIGERAEAEGICMECLSDRLLVELISGMARSGIPVSAILGMVGEGIEAAEAELTGQSDDTTRRMH